jgi:molecular chaperone DnaJ
MARVPDLYDVLGVSRDASDEDIKRSYRRLARELHPDVNRDPGAEQRFKEITAAYDVLKDPARRRQYDLFGTQGGAVGPDLFPFGDMGDLFDAFFGGFGGRRTGTRRRSRVQRGADLFATVTLSFEEAVFGTEKDVPIETLETCGRCDGTGCEPGTHASRCARCGGAGEIQDVSRSVFGTVMTSRTCPVCQGTGEEIASPCTVCRGEGRVTKRETIRVEIPAGVEEGMELRVGSQGQDGRSGGAPGDLYVGIRVSPHSIFERRGRDLVCALSVPMTQAALGAEIEIPTLDGEPERVRLDPGVESGAILRLRGRGVPTIGRRGRGDLFVTVEVETPNPKSKEERQLLERLAEIRGERPAPGDGPVGRLRKLLRQ